MFLSQRASQSFCFASSIFVSVMAGAAGFGAVCAWQRAAASTSPATDNAIIFFIAVSP